MSIRVRAVFQAGGPAFGFAGSAGRKRNGDEFTIDDSIFDPSWMEVVEVIEDPETPAKDDKKGASRGAKAEK